MTEILPDPICEVYWGSHGCALRRGHDGHHFCCCECENHPDVDSGCVGAFPYYGDNTHFYGEDAPERNNMSDLARVWFCRSLFGLKCTPLENDGRDHDQCGWETPNHE